MPAKKKPVKKPRSLEERYRRMKPIHIELDGPVQRVNEPIKLVRLDIPVHLGPYRQAKIGAERVVQSNETPAQAIQALRRFLLQEAVKMTAPVMRQQPIHDASPIRPRISFDDQD